MCTRWKERTFDPRLEGSQVPFKPFSADVWSAVVEIAVPFAAVLNAQLVRVAGATERRVRHVRLSDYWCSPAERSIHWHMANVLQIRFMTCYVLHFLPWRSHHSEWKPTLKPFLLINTSSSLIIKFVLQGSNNSNSVMIFSTSTGETYIYRKTSRTHSPNLILSIE